MDEVGKVFDGGSTPAFFDGGAAEERTSEIEIVADALDRAIVAKTNNITFDEEAYYSSSSSSTLNELVEGSSTTTASSSLAYDPCSDAISDKVCINSAQLAIICIACFTIIVMISVRVIFCCCNRRRRKLKRMPDILAEGDIIRTRLHSVSTSAAPPPRYSQIFDQDGISVFEEAPPDYETAQPDLLKSLPQNLSRTSSLASKTHQQSNDSPTIIYVGGPSRPEITTAIAGTADTEAPASSSTITSPPRPSDPEAPPIILSVNNLFRDSRQEVVSC